MEKRNVVFLTIIAVATLLTAVVGATFAFFSIRVEGNGNTATPTTVTTKQITGIEFQNTHQVTNVADGIYPGWSDYQTYTIATPTGAQAGATGKYTLTLTTTVPAEFVSDPAVITPADGDETDVKYAVYVVDTAEASLTTLTRTEGSLTNNNGQISKVDTVTPTGTKLAEGSLVVGTNKTISIPTDPSTGVFTAPYAKTYYVIYTYANENREQNTAMGKQFTAKLTAEVSIDGQA